MKATPACRPCLEKLVVQTAELATASPSLREKAKAEGLRVIQERFSPEAVTTRIASEFQRVIRQITGNPDPFEAKKKREMAAAMAVSGKLYPEASGQPSAGRGPDLAKRLAFALFGNSMDFFVDLETVRPDLWQALPGTDAIDFAGLDRTVDQAKRVLYLADNAGECFFDRPLVRYLRSKAKTVYVVKGSPVQNDMTLKDLERAGLKTRMGRVITTGNDFVGLDLGTASKEFQREYARADLIIAKGMGHWETMTELKPEGRVLFLLKAKCQPVADSLGAPLNTCVARLYFPGFDNGIFIRTHGFNCVPGQGV